MLSMKLMFLKKNNNIYFLITDMVDTFPWGKHRSSLSRMVETVHSRCMNKPHEESLENSFDSDSRIIYRFVYLLPKDG